MTRTSPVGVKDFTMMKNTSSNQNLPPRSKKSSRMSTRPTNPSSVDKSNRHKVIHNYHDHAKATHPDEIVDIHDDKRKGPRGGVTVPFPTKLHVMIARVEADGLSHIVSW